MGNFIIGVIVGITATTIGFTGIARLLDQGVKQTQEIVRQVDKN
jgi:capsular polysaccharide biosynthesis protein